MKPHPPIQHPKQRAKRKPVKRFKYRHDAVELLANEGKK